MTDLRLYGRQVRTVFDLLGDKENHLTASLGWALAESDRFLSAFLKRLFPHGDWGTANAVWLQAYGKDQGITDIEIFGDGIHLIVEAKRGWKLPSERQLEKYAKRLKDPSKQRAITVLAACTHEFADENLPRKVRGIAVRYLSWQQVASIAREIAKGGPLDERHLLREMQDYLRRVMEMQDQESNLAFVVALAAGHPSFSKLPWVEFVTKKRRYFHPFGRNGWPAIPPTYIAFRFRGELHQINHVDDAEVVTDLSDHLAEIDAKKWHARREGTTLLYKLGPPIYPAKKVVSGGVFGPGHQEAAIDLLLTSESVHEAIELTKKRKKQVKNDA